MPVHLEMMSATSASVTSSRNRSDALAAESIAASASSSCRCRFIRLPYLSSAALFRS